MTIKENYLTKRERDCMVSIREKGMEDFPLRLNELAGILKISSPTALNILRRLEVKGMIASSRGMIKLTEKGLKSVDMILKIHRVYESLFCQSGVSENTACNEASMVDYLTGEQTAEMVLHRIGDPKICPHGKPIQDDN